MNQTKAKEESIHAAVCRYISLQYPNVIFRTDMGGIRLTIGQAMKLKKLHSGRSYPDLFIAEARGGYHGLYLELKKDFSEVFKRDGSLRDLPHIQEQQRMLWKLQERGYCALFACGFDDAKGLIDNYLKQL